MDGKVKKRYGTTDFLKKYCQSMMKNAKKYEDDKTFELFEAILKVLDGFKT